METDACPMLASYGWTFPLIIVSSSTGPICCVPHGNLASISPDGRTLLSVGDSPDVYLHRVTGGSRVTFSQMMKLSLSPYITVTPTYTYAGYSPYSSYHSNNAVPASFSTAFSANGSKFAVASQDGVVVVWDVRSTKPLKVIQTDKERSSSTATGASSGWIYDAPFDWSRDWSRTATAKAPGWGVQIGRAHV